MKLLFLPVDSVKDKKQKKQKSNYQSAKGKRGFFLSLNIGILLMEQSAWLKLPLWHQYCNSQLETNPSGQFEIRKMSRSPFRMKISFSVHDTDTISPLLSNPPMMTLMSKWNKWETTVQIMFALATFQLWISFKSKLCIHTWLVQSTT